MDEYINKGALYEKIVQLEELARNRYLDTPSKSPFFSRYMEQLNQRTAFKHLIADFPAADVVPVIFCKYCKHYHAVIIDEKTGEIGDWGICDQPWRNEGYDVNETDYCSYAEPK